MPHLCACGCGVPLTGRRENVLYATDACRKRAWRDRTGYRVVGQRKPSQRRRANRKPDARISYRKAVDAIADMPELQHLPAGARARCARLTLDPILPPRLKDAA